MTIRYKCDSCGSTLNIKEELAGTQGKCPKCKTAFIVPQPSSAKAEKPANSPKTARQKPTSAKSTSSAAADEDFDPMAILMGDEGGGTPRTKQKRKPSPPPLSDEEVPADLDLELSFDEEADEPPAKKPKKRKRVQFDSDDEMEADRSASAAATAGSMLTTGASSGAKDLLTRTMEESRARASRIEEDEPRHQGPTIQDYLREFGPRGAAIAGGVLVAFIGLYYIADMMYGGGMDLPELGEVYGTVTLDGKPLRGAKVMFTPADKDERLPGKEKQRPRTSIATTNEEGYYELIYTEGVYGAAVTEHKVSIEKYAPDGQPITPADYSQYGTQTRAVESGSQEINFSLKSDPPPEPPKNRR